MSGAMGPAAIECTDAGSAAYEPCGFRYTSLIRYRPCLRGCFKTMFRSSDLTLLLFLAALFVFHSPFARWWSGLGLPWYTVFLLWLVVILLIAIKTFSGGSQGED